MKRSEKIPAVLFMIYASITKPVPTSTPGSVETVQSMSPSIPILSSDPDLTTLFNPYLKSDFKTEYKSSLFSPKIYQ